MMVELRGRVLLLIKGLGRGGAEQLFVNSAPHLDGLHWGYEVAYLLPNKDALVPEIRAARLPVHCLGYGARWVMRLRHLVRDRRIDIIHAHSPVPAVAARIALFGRFRPRLVYTEHNVWRRYHPVTCWANAMTYPLNDYVFTVAESVTQSILYPGPLRRRSLPPIETLHYGIDPATISRPVAHPAVLDEFGIPADAPVVGTVANFKPHKAHRYLIEAAARVRRAVPNVRFVLVGHGPLEEPLRRQATELGLDGAVVFTGYREDAARIAGAFDVFALASVQEGLPIALLEAMAQGRPPVVTTVGGLPEVVEDRKSGLLVPPAQPDAMADAITRLLRDDGLRSRLANAAMDRARRFDIRSAVRRTEQVYEELLA
jgi:glycosyltransferase involved in cell wall biosynthesis